MNPEEPLDPNAKGEAMELESWKAEWQSLGGREGLAAELAERVRKDGRRLRRTFAVEALAALAVTGYCAGLLLRNPKPVVVAYCVVALLFNGVWMTRLLTLREGTMRAVGEGLDAHLDLTRRRLADDLRWNHFTRRGVQVLAVLLTPWSIWMLVEGREFYAAAPWRAVVGFGGLVVILAAITITQRRKQKKLEAERARFEALVGERTLV